jgi:hypothetical protein
LSWHDEHLRPEALPLPDIVKDALTRPSNYVEYVKYSVKVEGDKKEPEKRSWHLLNEGNHAFYLGKIIPPSFADKVKGLVGWGKVKTHIYTPEVIKGMLDYAFRHVKDGEKVRLVIGSSLSELFNGPEDVENVPTLEKQRGLIQKIASKQFHKDESDLEITSFEEDKAHMLLYQVLRENIDEKTGVVDVSKALGSIGTEIESYKKIATKIDTSKSIRDMVNICPEAFFQEYDPSSLRFAVILYHAFEEDDRFRSAIENTVPPRIKESDSPSAAYYGLIEIAMRLSDISRGRFVHGGVERQEFYDQIIAKIIKGKDGGYKNIKALEPLFEIFEGKRFETMHLKTHENYYEVKKKTNMARFRLLFMATLALGSLGTAFGFGKYSEIRKQEQRQESVNSDLKKALKGVIVYDGPITTQEIDVESFNRIIDESLEDIGNRYGLPQEVLDELKPFLQKHFLDNKENLSTIHTGNHFLRIDLEDEFIQKITLFLKNKGIDTGRPYNKLLPYIGDFKALVESDEDISVDRKREPGAPISDSAREFEYIGTFYSGQPFNNKYEFYWYYDQKNKKHFYDLYGRKYLVATDGENTYYENVSAGPAGYQEERKYQRFTSKRGKEGVRQFLYAMARYDAVPLRRFESLLVNLYYNNNRMSDGCPGKERAVDQSSHREIIRYRDFLGRFDFELTNDSVFNPKTSTSRECLLARKPGENKFTEKRASELAGKYLDVWDAWNDYHSGKYIEAELPIDFKAIETEVEFMLAFIQGIEDTLVGTENFDEMENQMEFIRGISTAIKKEIGEYDGSYRSSARVLGSIERLRESYEELIRLISENTFIDECTQEPVSAADIIGDAEVNAKLNGILQARDAIMKVTWPKQEEKKVS